MKHYQQVNGFEHTLTESGVRLSEFLRYFTEEEQLDQDTRLPAPGGHSEELPVPNR